MVPLSRLRARASALLLSLALAAPVGLVMTGEGWQGSASAASVYSFGLAGDFGANANSSSVLNAVARSGVSGFFAIGDLSYSQVKPESAWCDYVKSRVGSSFPFELLAGNHEDDGPDGLIGKFGSCLPDRLGVAGDYPRQYYVDYPATSPLVRFVMISPNLKLGGSVWSYTSGSTRYNWTRAAIDGARAKGVPFVVVGMHEYCISMVSYDCAVKEDIMNLLIGKKVDLYLQAHDHAYNRSKQLALGSKCPALRQHAFDADCIVDANSQSAYTAGKGTVLATVGTGGRSINSQYPSLAPSAYFATYQGSGRNATYGFLKIAVTSTRLTGSFVRGAGGSFTDTFTITRP